MALVTEYDASWTNGTLHGYIYIKREGGSYQRALTLKKGSLDIQNAIPDWEDPVARMNCRFTVINDGVDFYDLMPLMTIEDGEYQIVVTETVTVSTLFIGYINCEAVDQNMLDWAELTITASGLVAKLANVHPPSLDTLQYVSLIDLIDECLTMTGMSHNIVVSCDLFETTAGYVANTTAFNRTGIFTELFWKNNVEKRSALEVLIAILKSFHCYLFWWNQKWWIIHYQNFTGSHTIVEYTTGVSYGYTDTASGSSASFSEFPIWDTPYFKQKGGTQRLSVIPGLRQLDIRKDLQQLDNLFYPDLTDIDIESAVASTVPYDRRTWYGQGSSAPNVTWSEEGESYNDIANAIKRFGYNITDWDDQLNGLTSRFAATVTWQTVIVITFKFGIHQWSSFKEEYESAYINNASDMKITFYWFLSNYVYPGARDYYVYDEVNDIWEEVVAGDPTTDYNTLEITAADIDEDLGTYSGTLKIRIGEVISTSSGDLDSMDFVFRMGTEERSGWPSGLDVPFTQGCYYGDFKCVTTNNKENNLIQGEITTDFLNKKTITLDVFDGQWHHRGALVNLTTPETLTMDWAFSGAPSTTDELYRWLMASKFRLYRVARQVITMTIYAPGLSLFGLLTAFADSKQPTKSFVLLSFVQRPGTGEYQLKLYEYDYEEDINLV